ncbi:PP1-complex regulatory subunit GLC8 [Aspergillus glaucus CBS 516.65]|uniref:Protein phosphatase inhibitor 2 (IPP-2) n=1 Tax=Aspergillus glaucus CBS 516.65 TaxID=1160497 RepID=A0A1L9V6N8_ASPGL|nr:hypothetical protein ASPGLDRAFT_77470 [Aspergillus glaucus CBS 516.65]OJJ79597.1 hypothetical protein ASPGLDRAFT_77470 [Aspergillus glaucus CBS 516.65]
MTMAHVGDKPKGILKNSSINPTQPPTTTTTEITISPPAPPADQHHSNPNDTDTKELTLQNTLQNAGRRRSSSATTHRLPSSRRPSLANFHEDDENNQRLRWDEANLYLAEQEKTAKMKIDEPKTPFAPQYDPAEDEEEMQMAEAEESLIDAQDVRVDELERGKKVVQKRPVAEEEIPELELGEAEESHPAGDEEERIVRERRASHDGEKHVVVGGEGADGGDGVGDELLSPEEAEEKHRKFEERRKRHYEMRNVKEILAHPEELDEMDEDEDEDEQPIPPPVPKIPERFHK